MQGAGLRTGVRGGGTRRRGWRARRLRVFLAVLLGFAGTFGYPGAQRTPAGFTTADVAALSPKVFPPGFLLGAATAAHQIEGGTHNDWTRFEVKPGSIETGEISGQAADGWHLVSTDIALLASLGANAYRFSIEWSRLEPTEGGWDEVAWAHYQDQLDQLHAAGIRPMVTLLHFTLPLWLADRGGVTAPDFPEQFGEFAAEAALRFGPRVELWCTINEPNIQMINGYLLGIWPPAVQSPAAAVQAYAGLLRAHAAAAAALHTLSPGAQVGVAMSLARFEPEQEWSLLDQIAAREVARVFDWSFSDAIASGRIAFNTPLPGVPRIDESLPGLAGSVDFYGVNYYGRNRVQFAPTAPGLIEVRPTRTHPTELGWEVDPEGLLQVLRTAHQRYDLPIYITENGIPDEGGKPEDYLRAHLVAVAHALEEGIPVQGYFYWTLVDSFEWERGFAPHFGLFKVDGATKRRSPGSGVAAFQQVAHELDIRRALPEDGVGEVPADLAL